MKNNIIDSKDLYMNRAQLLSMLVRAHVEVDVWGRGTGKSEGVIAERAVHNVFEMPRSKGIFLGPTYIHLLTNTLPPVIAMWRRMGYHRDVHYFMGRKPPKAWIKDGLWPDPYVPPLSYKHTIFWFNGSIQVLVSQDRTENAAGHSVDYIIGDEAKHLNYDKLSETFQTNRGNRQYFGDKSEHHSIVFCTDMPTNPKANWIFEYEEQMDKEAVEIVLAIQSEIIKLRNEKISAHKTKRIHIDRALKKYNRELNDIRKQLVYYSEFSTLENLQVVGEDYIREQKRVLTPLKYRTSILNEKPGKIEGGFYPMLHEDIHYYVNPNYKFLDSLNFDFSKIKDKDSRSDADVQTDKPLDIALDYNAAINSLTVGQQKENEYLVLNFLFVKSPNLVDAVVKKFVKYYQYHKKKEVHYYYDHTAVGKDALRDYSFADKVMEVLAASGWEIVEHYIGQAPHHNRKYNDINRGLKGESPIPKPRFNRTNCESLIVSMENADIRQGPTGFEKDKTSERDPNILPEHATHPSDSFDTLYWGRHMDLFEERDEFIDNTIY